MFKHKIKQVMGFVFIQNFALLSLFSIEINTRHPVYLKTSSTKTQMVNSADRSIHKALYFRSNQENETSIHFGPGPG